jgi:hypothetical protein
VRLACGTVVSVIDNMSNLAISLTNRHLMNTVPNSEDSFDIKNITTISSTSNSTLWSELSGALDSSTNGVNNIITGLLNSVVELGKAALPKVAENLLTNLGDAAKDLLDKITNGTFKDSTKR